MHARQTGTRERRAPSAAAWRWTRTTCSSYAHCMTSSGSLKCGAQTHCIRGRETSCCASGLARRSISTFTSPNSAPTSRSHAPTRLPPTLQTLPVPAPPLRRFAALPPTEGSLTQGGGKTGFTVLGQLEILSGARMMRNFLCTRTATRTALLLFVARDSNPLTEVYGDNAARRPRKPHGRLPLSPDPLQVLRQLLPAWYT